MRPLAVFLAVAVLLTGCTLLAGPPARTPTPTPEPSETSSGHPSWESFPHCPGAPENDWVLVEGYPVAELEAAGIRPECGDIWTRENGEPFTNLTAFSVPIEQIDLFGEELEDSGYDELYDDFQPAAPGGQPMPVGARDYYLDGVHTGDFTRVAIEIYSSGTDPQTYTIFVDFLSPATRALAG